MISIIIPVYNCGKYIGKCLDSLCNQIYTNFEVICINDGSLDNSLNIIEKYIDKFENFNVISIENHGQAYARNLGIKVSKGKYLCFIDSDDTVPNNYLMELNNAAATNENIDVVTCGLDRIFSYKASILRRKFSYVLSDIKKEEYNSFENPYSLVSVINAPFTKLIKRSFINENNLEFMDGKIYEDFYFTQSLLSCNPRIKVIDTTHYNYIVRKGSTMSNKSDKIYDFFYVFERLIEIYKNKEIYDRFHDEIEFLAINHIAIGTTYRLTIAKPFLFYNNVNICRTFLKKYNYSINNKYVSKYDKKTKLFLNLFFSSI